MLLTSSLVIRFKKRPCCKGVSGEWQRTVLVSLSGVEDSTDLPMAWRAALASLSGVCMRTSTCAYTYK